MGKSKLPRKPRAPNKIRHTDSLVLLYQKIVRPFLDMVYLHPEQRELKEGVETFFSVTSRPITWAHATESFTLPGPMWRDQSHPFNLLPGTGRRYVKAGDGVCVRQDANKNTVEIEFEEQVFVLTEAQFAVIKEKLKPRA